MSKSEIPSKFWAGGFLYNPKTQEIFLHRRDANTKFNPNKWAFFGGLNEGNETPVECFIRELEEEIGLKVAANQVISLCEYMNYEFNTYRIVFYVTTDVAQEDLILGEGAGFSWVSIKKLPTLDLTSYTEKDLKFFLEKVVKHK